MDNLINISEFEPMRDYLRSIQYSPAKGTYKLTFYLPVDFIIDAEKANQFFDDAKIEFNNPSIWYKFTGICKNEAVGEFFFNK